MRDDLTRLSGITIGCKQNPESLKSRDQLSTPMFRGLLNRADIREIHIRLAGTRNDNPGWKWKGTATGQVRLADRKKCQSAESCGHMDSVDRTRLGYVQMVSTEVAVMFSRLHNFVCASAISLARLSWQELFSAIFKFKFLP